MASRLSAMFIAWRTRSFLYPWLIHWFVVTFTLLVAVGRL